MDLRDAEKITGHMLTVQKIDSWIADLNMQDVAGSRHVAGFIITETLGHLEEETALAIRKVLRAELMSRRVRAAQELTKFGVEYPTADQA